MNFRGPIAKNARYPEYALEANRLDTFSDWPISIKQKPNQLSDAGFFYTGYHDRVVCFSCGGSLSQWEESDDVWEEHGYFYGDRCQYIQLCKGSNFRNLINEKRAKADVESQGEQITEKEEETKPNFNKDNPNECSICCINNYNTVFVPCGHVFACTKCASSLSVCPICRGNIENVLRIFLPV